MEEKDQPLTIYTFATAFRIRKELYHWDRFVFPRPIPVATFIFLIIWTLVNIFLLASGVLPLIPLGGSIQVFDFLGRFFVIPGLIAYIVNNIPAQGRSILRFFISKILRWFRPSRTRLGFPVKKKTLRHSQLTEIRLNTEKQEG